ncbi:MAG: DNA repair protein RadA [bacterium]
MAKAQTKIVYVCSSCGMDYLKWAGKCEACGEWNTMKEMSIKPQTRTEKRTVSTAKPQSLTAIKADFNKRLSGDMDEFDRVLGGGFVAGSVVLLSGDPGIGKSTLLLQICGQISAKQKVIYFSGEESAEQIKLRAERLKVNSNNLFFSGETETGKIISTLEKEKPGLVIIDSIQTMFSANVDTTPGSMTQLRESTLNFTEVAKRMGIPILLIGHVTKEGTVAGPRMLEHMVDVMLYLEGDRYQSYRILRGVKNRFGSTNETGIFEMTGDGLKEVKNPSGVFLEERAQKEPGTAITAVIEGTRPFLVEVQALSSRTVFGYPKRTASGIDINRLHVLLAVLSRKANLGMESHDVYVNVVGGMKISEPAVDLALLIACASSFTQKEVLADTVIFGEVGLSGEVRSVNQVDKRVAEIIKLGFKKVIVPKANLSMLKTFDQKIKIIPVQSVSNALKQALVK